VFKTEEAYVDWARDVFFQTPLFLPSIVLGSGTPSPCWNDKLGAKDYSSTDLDPVVFIYVHLCSFADNASVKDPAGLMSSVVESIRTRRILAGHPYPFAGYLRETTNHANLR